MLESDCAGSVSAGNGEKILAGCEKTISAQQKFGGLPALLTTA